MDGNQGPMPVFTKTEKLALINAVIKKKVIWDTSHPKHLDLEAVNQAWREIAQQLKKDVTVCYVSFKLLSENRVDYSKVMKIFGSYSKPLARADEIKMDFENATKMSFPSDVSSKRKTCQRAIKMPNKKHTSFESTDDSCSEADIDKYLAGNQSSMQPPEDSKYEQDRQYSTFVAQSEGILPKAEPKFTIDLTAEHSSTQKSSSTQMPVSASVKDEKPSTSCYCEKNPKNICMTGHRMMQESTLQQTEMYAFWDSIIKEIPSEALSEIKLEVTATLHNIYKKYKKDYP